ncbi:hypothetical protein IVB41_25215 [Bradyrhizobium sp. 44]|uniref:hypothetical protein n=1 Tax=unclassified Bradyrhizobium TaxID=2631580 RepID=UPI000489F216|nr:MULTISPECIES: hypothetical protein [unclassified Bradyrhizobium]MCK1287214.1 hypothetical protein [Bradyrhizobium sp. 44]
MTERDVLAELDEQVIKISAETLAMQFVLTCLLQRLGALNVGFTILQAFDDAANHSEQFSIGAGKKAGHLPETLRIIEQMRLMLVGEGKPRREV